MPTQATDRIPIEILIKKLMLTCWGISFTLSWPVAKMKKKRVIEKASYLAHLQPYTFEQITQLNISQQS